MARRVAAAPKLNASIAAVLEQTCTCWNVQDYRGLRDLWDSGEAEPWYIAEEVNAPLIGWADIEAYWQTHLGLLERSQVRYSDLRTKHLATDLTLAIYTLRFLPKASGGEGAMGGESRVTALLRQTNKSWRFCHLVEAPLSPVTYMRRFFERGADRIVAAAKISPG